jgi:hypothetical protein
LEISAQQPAPGYVTVLEISAWRNDRPLPDSRGSVTHSACRPASLRAAASPSWTHFEPPRMDMRVSMFGAEEYTRML